MCRMSPFVVFESVLLVLGVPVIVSLLQSVGSSPVPTTVMSFKTDSFSAKPELPHRETRAIWRTPCTSSGSSRSVQGCGPGTYFCGISNCDGGSVYQCCQQNREDTLFLENRGGPRSWKWDEFQFQVREDPLWALLGSGLTHRRRLHKGHKKHKQDETKSFSEDEITFINDNSL